MAYFKGVQTAKSQSTGIGRRSKRAGTKSKVIGHSKSKPTKSRYARIWKVGGVAQVTSSNPRFKTA